MDRPIVVIGAGVVGTATALTLRRQGHATVLLDPDPPGQGASSGNAGCLNPSSILPIAMPGVLRQVPGWLLDADGPLRLRPGHLPRALPWLWRLLRSANRAHAVQVAAALHGLLDGAVARTRALARGTGAEALVEQAGHLVVYPDRGAAQADTLAAELRAAHGISEELWDAGRLRQAEPDLAPHYRAARFFPDNGHLRDPARFVALLAGAFVAGGGGCVRGRAAGFRLREETVEAVYLDDGRQLEVTAVVVCAGAHAATLAARLGERVVLDAERGYHVMLPATGPGPRLPTMEGGFRIVATPMDGGLRVAGTVELAGLDAPPDWRRAELLLTQARRMYPGLPPLLQPDSRWMGLRPSTPDSLPVIGRSLRFANAWHAFGHGHVGLTAAAATAQAVAALVRGEAPAFPLQPFSVGRF